jgi:diguanylate cyclase
MNNDPAQLEHTHSFMRLALPLMSKHNVPITPPNYTVWYNHVSGMNDELSREIEQNIQTGTAFTAEVNERLYRCHCARGDEGEILKLREGLQQVLLAILKDVAGLSGQTERYENVVATSVAQLSTETDAGNIGRIVGDIIAETREMLSFGQSLQKKLAQTNAELQAIQKEFEQVKSEAMSDFLTGAPNRKAFTDTLSRMMTDPDATEKGLCLLMVDIDHFKRFNDRFGHIVGDEVLKFVAKRVKSLLKGRDFLARFGGEEFVALLPCTDLAGAAAAAENIRKFFAESKLKTALTKDTLGSITISIGAASHRPGEKADQFIERADRALYKAKTRGRNCVATESDLT